LTEKWRSKFIYKKKKRVRLGLPMANKKKTSLGEKKKNCPPFGRKQLAFVCLEKKKKRPMPQKTRHLGTKLGKKGRGIEPL